MGDFLHNIWSKRIDFYYKTKSGTHRYYVLISCVERSITLEFHHLKKSLVTRINDKSFYETLDILGGCPPKKYMKEFRDLIVSECKYVFKCHKIDWDDSLIPIKLY